MRAKQIFFFFTRIIAKIVYLFDRKRANILRERQEIVRIINKRSYIDTVSRIIYEQNLILNPYFGEEILKINSIIEAEKLFNYKKKHGDFDNLNTLLK